MRFILSFSALSCVALLTSTVQSLSDFHRFDDLQGEKLESCLSRDVEVVEEFITSACKTDKTRCLVKAVQADRSDVVDKLLLDGAADPTVGNHSVTKSAVTLGNARSLERLFLDSRVLDRNNLCGASFPNDGVESVNRGVCVGVLKNLFIKASRKGFVGVIKILMNVVDPTDAYQEALKTAALFGRLPVINLLLDHAMSLSTIEAAFVNAAKSGHFAVVNLLYDQYEKRSEAMPKLTIFRAFEAAAESGCVQVVRGMIESDMIRSVAFNRSATLTTAEVGDARLFMKHLYQALVLATKFGHRDVVSLLLSHRPVNPRVAVSTACSMDNLEILEVLFAHELENPLEIRRQAAHIAAQLGKLRIVTSLLKDKVYGVQLYPGTLLAAIYGGYYDVVDAILALGLYDEESLPDSLHYAVRQADLSVVKRLLETPEMVLNEQEKEHLIEDAKRTGFSELKDVLTQLP